MDPAIGLGVGLLVIGVFFLVFLPRRGLLARWRRNRVATIRVLVEDALKHIHDCEYRGTACSLQSVAGALTISADEAARVVARLEAMRLVTSTTSTLALTPEGRTYALRVIRIHRLWEHYLADETGLGETEWHQEAERREHLTTAEEANALAERMGNPGFDPHGDPIPTAAGLLPRQRGIPLTELPVGRPGRIVHIEDEPHAVYTQLVAEGLHLGMLVRLIDVESDRVRFTANHNECVLAPLHARNVSVLPLAAEEDLKGKHETLANLRPGERGVVAAISSACRGAQRRRLMDLGLVPGTHVAVELTGMGGDPAAYRVRGSVIALRRRQADQVVITREGSGV
jgi:DtxR family Mn-dependent transcriptional regulator